MKKLLKTCLAALFLTAGIHSGTTEIYAAPETAPDTVRILFTGSLYDHISPFKLTNAEGNPQLYGGYAHILTKMDEYRSDKTVLVDTGNFSRGTFYEALNTRKAPDLTLMNIMRYDAVNLGTDDAQAETLAFTDMLKTAEDMPLLVSADLAFGNSEFALDLKEEWNEKGASGTVIEKGGVKVGIFGIADEGTYGDFIFANAAESAKKEAARLKQEGADVIICLYDGKELESSLCALDIDVLISSSEERAEKEQETVNGTLVVSPARYGKSFGVLDYNYQTHAAVSFSRVTVESTKVEPHGSVNEKIRSYQEDISALVFAPYGYTWGTPVAYMTVPMTDKPKEGVISDFLADAYQNSYNRANDDAKPVLSILPGKTGMIEYTGTVTINDLYTALGASSPLVRVYISGRDLRTLCEMDYQMFEKGEESSLHFGKMRYMYSLKRFPTNRVEDVNVEAVKGYFIPLDEKKMYPVVTDLSLPDEIARMKEKSGLNADVTLCDKSGTPLTDLSTQIITADGRTVYPWTAAAAYLKTFERIAAELPTINDDYLAPRPKRIEDTAFNAVRYFRHLDLNTYKRFIYWPIGAAAVIIFLKLLVKIVNRQPKEK
ncbi:MAG: 5'-nucleotidase C-terminal domain-containing protein [Solobacterium sp.]|nr:5'-nucleotidase C-terminal domain-containing protein [Solobacterium sp.]